MRVMRRWLSLLLLPVLSLAGVGCRPPTEKGSTRLEFELYGGFAYVPTPSERRLEIAYLRDTEYDQNGDGQLECKVDQLGVDLMVVSGTIVEPASPPPSRMFDLEGAVVTFPALESAELPLETIRGTRPPNRPQNPSEPRQWEDLKWVPAMSREIPNAAINPQWRDLVDGRIVLRGGSLKGLHPSDVVVRDAMFEFRDGAANVRFAQAVTDRTVYRVAVPGNRVEMHLTGAKSGITRIVVQPTAAGRPVQLKLIGRHAMQTPAQMAVGDPVADFCAFYQLMEPIPPASDWLIPHFVGTVAQGGPAAGQPSPGPFCPGDWY